MGTSWAELRLIAPRRRSRRLYSADLHYMVPITTPNGDHLEFECWAYDSDEAAILAAESLLPEWGETCEDVAAYVGTPERIRRSA